MNDLISRQAAMNAFAERVKRSNNSDFAPVPRWNDAVEIVENLPSVQPQRWIPVSEALPKDDEEVIVTCLDDSGDTPFSYTTVAWHYKGMWVCDNERCPFVVAWMPLPEPWKGADDDSKRD